MEKRTLTKAAARAELVDAKQRYTDMLAEFEGRCVVNNAAKDGFLYLMAIPVIYSAWEAYFKMTMSICLKRLHSQSRKANRCDASYVALWLQKEGFVTGFLQNLLNAMNPGTDISKKLNMGKFKALADFSRDMAIWHSKPVPAQRFEDLVMTHSNINRAVVEANAEIIGLDLNSLNFGRLDELLSRRNDISHGGLVALPQEATVQALFGYVKNLISDFHCAVLRWLSCN
ncbi:MAE_28990/MAE_18760 family HEPN-like nuclease [Achromobacter sp. Root170]|uniref:MAE_28990/MAE_18760 family HEPN-like nuclease n=1 Tax=Achromobacter sp. Root170 TaxID=1736480 RepID=UPI000A732421|nr:MAE_28990/MAE_18760 family HEPN-like nuclease [Achromobacter sp. Root170]